MVENFDKMLAGSLRLEDPWYIIGAEFNEEEPAIHTCGYRQGGCAVLSAVRRPNGTATSRRSAPGVMRTACFIPVMSTASVPVFSATNAAQCRSMRRLSARTVALPCCSKATPCYSCKMFLVPEPPVCFAVTKSRSPLSLRIGCMTR